MVKFADLSTVSAQFPFGEIIADFFAGMGPNIRFCRAAAQTAQATTLTFLFFSRSFAISNERRLV
jgi:hypothetical protein